MKLPTGKRGVDSVSQEDSLQAENSEFAIFNQSVGTEKEEQLKHKFKALWRRKREITEELRRMIAEMRRTMG